MPTFLNDVNLNGNRILNVNPVPTSGSEAASKQYVDSLAQGLKVKGNADALSTTPIATLSGLSTVVDGVPLNTDGMIVLLTAQVNSSSLSSGPHTAGPGAIDNGAWVVHAGAWTRPDNFANGSRGAGSFWFVTKGTVHADQGWVCATDDPYDVVGTDDLVITQFSAAGVLVAGDGITITSGEINVDVDNATIEVSGTNKVQVKDDGITAAKINSDVAGAGLTQDGGGALQVNVGAGVRIVTDAVALKAVSADVGGSTSVAIAHNFGTRDVLVLLRSNSSPYDQVYPDIEMTDTNTVTFKFAVAPGAAAYRATILANV